MVPPGVTVPPLTYPAPSSQVTDAVYVSLVVAGSLNASAAAVLVPVATGVSEPVTPLSVGATLFTVMEIVSTSFNAGDPLSVTMIVIDGDCGPSLGVHVNTPVEELMLAPA